MNTMITFPSPFECESVVDYLASLREMNKDHEGFSIRKLSRDLGWPIGLIPDVLGGRKSLSLLRTLEVASYANHSPIETERLVAISCLQNIPELYRKAITSPASPNVRGHKLRLNGNSLFLFFVTFEIIKWKDGRVTLDYLQSALKQQGFSRNQIESTVESLIEQNIIKRKSEGQFEVLENNLDYFFNFGVPNDQRRSELPEDENGQLQADFLANFLRFCESPHDCYIYLSTVLSLDRKDFPEYRQRICSLTNWLHERSDEADRKQCSLFQVTVGMFPAFEGAARPK